MSANLSSDLGDTSQDMPVISLATLPYDLLLNIARHLELLDIYALQLVSSDFLSHSASRIGYASISPGRIGSPSRGLPVPPIFLWPFVPVPIGLPRPQDTLLLGLMADGGGLRHGRCGGFFSDKARTTPMR